MPHTSPGWGFQLIGALLLFSHNQIFPVWNSLSIYMEDLFSQNIHDEDRVKGALILCYLLEQI